MSNPKAETLQCQHTLLKKIGIKKCFNIQTTLLGGNQKKKNLYFKKQRCPLVFKLYKMFGFKNIIQKGLIQRRVLHASQVKKAVSFIS